MFPGCGTRREGKARAGDGIVEFREEWAEKRRVVSEGVMVTAVQEFVDCPR